MARNAKSKRKRAPKTVLKLPDLEQSKSAVLNSLTSPSSQRSYDHAIREFIDWYCSEPRLAFNKTVPNNLIGTVDLYLTTHHGLFQSNAKVIVDALHPRVAIINNGPHKGGSPEAWETIHNSPGLEDLWQLHYALDSDKEHNVADTFIANPAQNCEGHYIKVAADPDGSFTVFNSRNDYKKTYPKSLRAYWKDERLGDVIRTLAFENPGETLFELPA
jgi:hypothetical protein